MPSTAIKIIVLGIAALGIVVMGYWRDLLAWSDRAIFVVGKPIEYTVVPGATVESIGEDLKSMKILSSSHYFAWMARSSGKARNVQTGEYWVIPGMTPRGFLDALVNGHVIQHKVTLIEGWIFDRVRRALSEHPKVLQTLTGLDRQRIMERLGFAGRDPEGLFFPDTYYFTAGTSDLELLQRAYRRMEELLHREWSARDKGLPYKTPYEVLIMASIIEKETSIGSERPEIAGVFLRRLERGMPLQTDPSVIYVLGDAFAGDLKRSHLGIDSPYNTYRNVGLTPTPIALPGAESIRAVLHPAAGAALYFVAKGDGHHHFSGTLEDHEQAIARYQIVGRKDSR